MIITKEHIHSYQYSLQCAKAAQGADRLHYAKQALEQATDLSNETYIIEISLLLADTYIQQDRFKTAQHYLTKIKTGFESHLNENQKYQLYSLLTQVHLHLQEWSEALLTAFSALKMNRQQSKVGLYNNIAIAFNYLGKYEKGMCYLEQALTIATNNHKPTDVCACLISMGTNLAQQEKNTEAITYFKKAQTVAQNHYVHRFNAIILGNLAKSYENTKQWNKAIAYIEQSITISQKEGKIELELALKQNLAEVYIELEQFDKASFYLNEVLNHPQIKNYSQLLIATLDVKHTLLAKEKNFEAAYHCLHQLRKIEETYYEGNRDKKLTALIEQQELEISLLEGRNEQIQEQSNILTQQNKELQQLAFIVAHDLKEPLRSINGFTQLLLKGFPEDLRSAKQVTYATHITEGVVHMRNLLDDLLVYTGIRHQNNKSKVTQSAQTVLNSVLFSLKDIIAPSNANITSLIKANQDIRISEQHLFLLFKNLLHNAIKFTKPDDVPNIEIGMLHLDDGMCLFSIKDNGIGINQNYQEQIFKIFNRLDKRSYKGTGIGLAICEKIVQLYGGEIWVTSKEGIGTTFHFTLPYIKNNASGVASLPIQ
ncbi:MAG: ATP-binding protein [Chitinophagales bacterium]